MTPRETDIKDTVDLVKLIMSNSWHTLVAIPNVIARSYYCQKSGFTYIVRIWGIQVSRRHSSIPNNTHVSSNLRGGHISQRDKTKNK